MKLVRDALLGCALLGSMLPQPRPIPSVRRRPDPNPEASEWAKLDEAWKRWPEGPPIDGPIDPSTFKATPIMSPAEAERFLTRFIDKERAFYRPGVAFDAKTGMTFDGHPVSFETGLLVGVPRPHSAASKESLHVGFLALAVAGDPVAKKLVGENALGVLEKKIATYEAFDARYPGFGGFLPWYFVRDGEIVSADNWHDRVPGLDNGQLAWSIYLAAHVLEDHGHTALAARYRARLDEMKKNLVPVFYDPSLKKLRAEANLIHGPSVPPDRNQYETRDARFMLDDPYEGTLLSEFAASFADWSSHPEGREAIWRNARRERVTYTAPKSGVEITIDRGVWHSAHEQWAFAVLPYLDDPTLRAVFENTQKARTINAAELRECGLGASANEPRIGDGETRYVSALGIRAPNVTREPNDPRKIFTPYGAFPLGLVPGQRPVFATWLKMMSDAPGMMTPYGVTESYSASGALRAPLLTWDVKGLVALSIMGGFTDAMRPYLIKDGVYDAFRARVARDRAAFDGKPILGEDVKMRGPSVRVPRRRPAV